MFHHEPVISTIDNILCLMFKTNPKLQCCVGTVPCEWSNNNNTKTVFLVSNNYLKTVIVISVSKTHFVFYGYRYIDSINSFYNLRSHFYNIG